MKKIFFIPTLILTLFLTMNKVNADTINYDYTYPNSYINSSNFSISESQLVQIIENSKNEFINYWRDNLSSNYPYYYIALDIIGGNAELRLDLIFSSDLSELTNTIIADDSYSLCNTHTGYLMKTVYSSDNTPTYSNLQQYGPGYCGSHWGAPYFFQYRAHTSDPYTNYFNPFSYYQSNFSYTYTGSNTLNVIKNNNTLFSITAGNIIPTYIEEFDVTQSFTEINLNNYNSVILSLKDYSSRNSFNTTIPTLGQLCLTPVYDYGMKNKGDYYPGYEVQGCTPQYSEFTPVSISILSSDIDNHAVYYVKPYNFSIQNKIKVDTTIFDITYVTSENANNPTVIVGGRSYPVIPYSDLSSSATTSTENGYIPGASCQLGDLNCQSAVSGMDISDLFTHPLELLKDMWSAITSVFSVITAFILLLPTPLQTFLYVAFMFAVILGILKLILGG